MDKQRLLQRGGSGQQNQLSPLHGLLSEEDRQATSSHSPFPQYPRCLEEKGLHVALTLPSGSFLAFPRVPPAIRAAVCAERLGPARQGFDDPLLTHLTE